MNLYYASSIFLLGTLASADDNQVRRRLAKQSNACILTKNLVHWKGDDMRVEESWQCELLDDDRRNAGQRFVTIEGLNQADYDLTRSGLTSLFVSGAIIGNGKMTVPKGALKQYEKIEPRGPAGKRKSRKNKNKTTNHIGKTKDNQRNLAPVVVDTRKVLAVRVKANDSTTSATLSQLSNEIFGTSGKVVNLRERMESCSYGELLMEPYEGTTATGIAITNGVVQLNMNLNVKGRTRDSVTTDVENALEEYLGDLPNQFDHVILCLPPGTGGNWVASGKCELNYMHWSDTSSHDPTFFWTIATVGGWRSVFNDGVCNLTEIQVHELGHNLGLNHASEEGDRKPEYGDYTGTMGGVYSDDPKFCFNPAKSWQLGWYSLRHISLDFTSRGSFRGQLIGIDDYQDPNAAGKYVNIKIIRPGSKNAIYVGFNLAAGINLNTDEAPNLVTIQTQTGSDNSWLVAKLALGQNHTIANFIDGKTLFIDVRSITMNSSLPVADVDIYLGSFAECQVNSDCTRGDACAVGTCQPGRICSYDTSACSGNFVLKLNTDTYPEETSWQVEDLCKGQVVLSKASYKSRDTLITETGILGMSQFRFTLFDSHGDGLCCGSQGPTELNVSFNGFQVGTFRDDFGSSVSLLFGASTCGSPPTPPPSIPPTAKPTAFPTLPPTTKPTMPPTPTPTAKPTVPPTPRPTLPPTRPPTAKPTVPPTRLPTAKPTVPPTPQPTLPPTAKPTVLPTSPPTPPPTAKPTAPPTPPPTLTPVGNPVMFLTDISNNPGPGFPLQECHGDCDSDADCQVRRILMVALSLECLVCHS